MKKIIVLLLLAAAGFGTWKHFHPVQESAKELVLYGNVDQRQIELAFIDSERVAEVLAEEGDTVQSGQVLARLETRRLHDKIAVAEAKVASSEAILLRLKNGTRPEEIEKAKSAVASAKAETAYARSSHARYSKLYKDSKGQAVSRQDVDQTLLQLNVALARQEEAESGLKLAELGPRDEEILEAEAAVRQAESSLAELRNQLEDAALKAPSASVVTRRLLEPGDMASPQRAVFSLSVQSPKWVRAYVSETDMGKIDAGTKAVILSDSHAGKQIDGTIGFISSVAEFTPKSVETTELRTSLVYEVRVYTEDPENLLRLGMPVTVRFPGVYL